MSHVTDNKPSGNQEDEADARLFGKAKKDHAAIGRLSVHKDSKFYKMDYDSRGRCIIFNHEDYDKALDPTGEMKREGTSVDQNDLKRCFGDLGFDVFTHNDFSTKQITETLEEEAKIDHSNKDCFVCVFLTHGEEGYLYARNDTYPVDSIFKPFLGNACPSLAGKPKIFFIQACRGNKLDSGMYLEESVKSDSGSRSFCKIPNCADFLVAYSTVSDYFSWRNTEYGSWFIQALVEVLEKHAQENDLLEMLTYVNHQVAYYRESFTTDPKMVKMNHRKQIPTFTSTLTRKVHFRKRNSD